MGKWIRVKDKLPELFKWYLVCYKPEYSQNDLLADGEPMVLMGFFDEAEGDLEHIWLIDGGDVEDCDITHWMPLPEPPES